MPDRPSSRADGGHTAASVRIAGASTALTDALGGVLVESLAWPADYWTARLSRAEEIRAAMKDHLADLRDEDVAAVGQTTPSGMVLTPAAASSVRRVIA